MVKDAKTVLARVHKVIADGHTDMGLCEVLVLANVTQDEYSEALEVSNKGSVVLLIMYVASYMMKTDRAMGVLLKRVASEATTEELKSQMGKVGSAFLTHRGVHKRQSTGYCPYQ